MKRLQNSQSNSLRLPALLGSAALLALLAAPVAPAIAQGAPDQLRYLDPPKPSNSIAQTTEDQQRKVRNAYARVRVKKSDTHQ